MTSKVKMDPNVTFEVLGVLETRTNVENKTEYLCKVFTGIIFDYLWLDEKNVRNKEALGKVMTVEERYNQLCKNRMEVSTEKKHKKQIQQNTILYKYRFDEQKGEMISNFVPPVVPPEKPIIFGVSKLFRDPETGIKYIQVNTNKGPKVMTSNEIPSDCNFLIDKFLPVFAENSDPIDN